MINLFLLLGTMLLLFTENCSSSIAPAPVFTVHPVSINTTEGTVVTFTCTANNSPISVVFQVDGDSAIDTNKGFDQLPAEPLVNDTRSRTLEVTTSVANNDNSRISCFASGANTNGNSNTAILRVQGHLSLVVDLSYYFIDSSTVNISWSPPFTLPGTDITGYNVSATASNGTTANHFTSNSYYELSLTDITDSPCTEVIITVSGYNGLDGENTTISAPSSQLDLPIVLSIEANRILLVELNVSVLCELLPNLINISLTSNGTLLNHTVINMLPNDYNNNTLVEYTVNEDRSYTVSTSVELFNGAYVFTNEDSIDTFDVQSVRVLNSSDGSVCLECVFAVFSTDTNCTVELVSSSTERRYKAVLQRPMDARDPTAVGCVMVNNNDKGPFELHVIEQDSNMGRIIDVNVTIIDTLMSTTITPSASLGHPPSSVHLTSYSVTSIYSTLDSTVSSSPPNSLSASNRSNNPLLIPIAVGASAAVFLTLLIFIIVVVIFLTLLIKRGKRREQSYDVNKQQTNVSYDEGVLYANPADCIAQTKNGGNNKPAEKQPQLDNYCDPVDVIKNSTMLQQAPAVPKRPRSLSRPHSIQTTISTDVSITAATPSPLPLYSEPYVKSKNRNGSTNTGSNNNLRPSPLSPKALPDVVDTASPLKAQPYEVVNLPIVPARRSSSISNEVMDHQQHEPIMDHKVSKTEPSSPPRYVECNHEGELSLIYETVPEEQDIVTNNDNS